MKRDSSVELTRIIGCMIVIGVHTILSPTINDTYAFRRIFLACVLGDGVAVFWFVTGFFCFGNSYKRILIKTLRNIIIPMTIFTVFSTMFSGILLNGETLLQSMSYTKQEYFSFAKTLLTWNNAFPYCDHLWYLYTYIVVVLCFPILKSFTDYLDNDSELRWRVFVIISFLILVLNDITSNQMCSFSHRSFSAFLPASLEVIYGYHIYKHKGMFCDRKFMFIAPGVFVLANVLRAFIQYKRFIIDSSNNWILYWFSGIGVVCAIAIVAFCFSLDSYIRKHKRFEKVILSIGKHTFYIYLIHMHIIIMLNRYGIIAAISNTLNKIADKWCFDFLYTFTVVFIIFCIALIVSILIKQIESFAKNAIGRIAQ